MKGVQLSYYRIINQLFNNHVLEGEMGQKERMRHNRERGWSPGLPNIRAVFFWSLDNVLLSLYRQVE